MPATTPRGFPYPLPTEPIAEGAQAIRNLAEAIDAKEGFVETVLLAANGKITFSAIPQTYTHLSLVASLRSAAATPGEPVSLRFNDDAAANYSGQQLWGFGASSVSGQSLAPLGFGRLGMSPAGTAPSGSTWGALTASFPNYRGNKFKAWTAESFGLHTNVYSIVLVGGIWAQVAAITKLLLMPEGGGDFVAGSTASLYGIR